MILSADAITVAFAGRVVLDGFSVELDDGDRCALTGRSGSGKTTLLLVLAGLLRPTSGTVELRPRPDEIVYVPQTPSLVPELTALQNASLGLRIRGVAPDAAEDRARDQLRALGLTDTDDALPAELSGGMQQRVALARALAVEPRLLLADDPPAPWTRRPAPGSSRSSTSTPHAPAPPSWSPPTTSGSPPASPASSRSTTSLKRI